MIGNGKTHLQMGGGESGKKIKNYVYHYADLIGKGNFARVYRGVNTLTRATTFTQKR